MSLARVMIDPVPGAGPADRQVTVDCAHGTTRVYLLNAAVAGLDQDDAVRLALARHYQAERCRCARRAWRRAFGAPLGEAVLVRGAER